MPYRGDRNRRSVPRKPFARRRSTRALVYILLVFAGFCAGFMNVLAGGGSFVTSPVLIGGLVGMAVGRRVPTRYVRWFVIAVGLVLTLGFFARVGVG